MGVDRIRSIPVVMFHGVAPDAPDRPPQAIHWLEPSLLERYLARLRRDRFQALFLNELREYREGKRHVSSRAAVLTFDDGYLDFWLYAFPLLKKYEIKATIFVTTDFIDGDHPPRRLGVDSPYGFLSWAELREMEASGLVDVQSHAVTHTWYPISPLLVDVHRPDLPWRTFEPLWWNRFPDRKPQWFRDGARQDVPWGTPVLQYEKSLVARRYLLSPAIQESMVRWVAERGGPDFFRQANWRDEYRRRYEMACEQAGDGTGTYEDDDQRRARLTYELGESRRILEEGLGKEVRYLCCPAGSLNDEVLGMANDLGYQGTSVPAWFEPGLNRVGGNIDRFYRIGSNSIFDRVRSEPLDALSFGWRMNSELGRGSYRLGWFALRVLRKLRLI